MYMYIYTKIYLESQCNKYTQLLIITYTKLGIVIHNLIVE